MLCRNAVFVPLLAAFVFAASCRAGAAGADDVACGSLVSSLMQEKAYREARTVGLAACLFSGGEAGRRDCNDGARAAASLRTAAAGMRLGGAAAERAREELSAVVNDTSAPMEIRCEAAILLGGRDNYVFALFNTRDGETALVSSLAVYSTLINSGVRTEEDSYCLDIASAYMYGWTSEIREKCAGLTAVQSDKLDSGGGLWSFLSGAVVGGYRFFVAPAIGSRCVLEPSCSRYFTDAASKHGIMCVPMIFDRFYREPQASACAPRIEMPDGSFRGYDPVEYHDFWFSGEE